MRSSALPFLLPTTTGSDLRDNSEPSTLLLPTLRSRLHLGQCVPTRESSAVASSCRGTIELPPPQASKARLSHRTLLLLLVFAGLVAGVLYLGRGPAAETLEVRAGERDPSSAAIHTGDHDARADSGPGARSEVGGSPAHGEVAARTVVVVGRCVRHDDLAKPVAGVGLSVRLDLTESSLYATTVSDVMRWRRPEPVSAMARVGSRFACRCPSRRFGSSSTSELPMRRRPTASVSIPRT